MPLLFTISRDLYFLTDSRYTLLLTKSGDFYFGRSRRIFTLDQLEVCSLQLLLIKLREFYLWQTRENSHFWQTRGTFYFLQTRGTFYFWPYRGTSLLFTSSTDFYFWPNRRTTLLLTNSRNFYFWPTRSEFIFYHRRLNATGDRIHLHTCYCAATLL